MIRYSRRTPGGNGNIASFIRLWWLLVHSFHTTKFLVKQAFESHRRYNYRMQPRGNTETVVITGGTRGIGAELVKKLLQCNMHVIIGCRDPASGRNVLSKIRQRGITTGTAEILTLDLTSLNSVREFAYKILSKNIPINTLINNAGVMDDCYGVTVEDMEHHFQINYLAHFLLTNLLLQRMHESGAPGKHSRVVNVSSIAHYGAYIDLSDPLMNRFYSSHKAYMDSKFCQVVFSNFLNSLLQYNSANVRSYAVHPGFAKTERWKDSEWIKRLGVLQRLLFKVKRALIKNLSKIQCPTLSPELEESGGAFISNCEVVEPLATTEDAMLQRRLWNTSCGYVDLLSSCVDLIGGPSRDDVETNNWNSTGNRKTSKCIESYCLRPYYEYLIVKLFTLFNAKKRGWLQYIEVWSILLLQKLDRLNSQFKVLNVYES
ncbi:Dehydrogenase/reductase SDR family member on chromosome X [Orchesella cincta]|uniref:Dehydrogenase/reductase SDR family member on chromosome X n=1 Tax=Orchesella cincta TaxID=48709 RepID=A0A1D2MFX4_ORCCI|nr:Dehydrogenase/reductase SDR family member on chromosome X [Orchesella cincta]